MRNKKGPSRSPKFTGLARGNARHLGAWKARYGRVSKTRWGATAFGGKFPASFPSFYLLVKNKTMFLFLFLLKEKHAWYLCIP